MKAIHFFRTKWTLAVLIILGLVFFEGRFQQENSSADRQIASEGASSEELNLSSE